MYYFFVMSKQSNSLLLPQAIRFSKKGLIYFTTCKTVNDWYISALCGLSISLENTVYHHYSPNISSFAGHFPLGRHSSLDRNSSNREDFLKGDHALLFMVKDRSVPSSALCLSRPVREGQRCLHPAETACPFDPGGAHLVVWSCRWLEAPACSCP